MDRNDAQMIPAETPWLADPRAQAVCRMLTEAGHQVYFVGGCVRNALLDAPVSDVDMCTDAHPDRVMELAASAGLKPRPTGIDHGTVTVISGGEPFEVTTFRRDVETDGRRAVVAFADNIEDDARRRDFTMNALYATPEGDVVDPLNGLADLRNRQIKFIENADLRIREDYLRTLRFFRFHAWYGDPDQGFDPNALDAIATNLSGLETLSAERVGAEMRKLLSAVDPAPALAGMAQTGVLNQILPGTNTTWIAPIVHFENALGIVPNWQTRLVALGGDDPSDTLRLSNVEGRAMAAIKHAAFDATPLLETAYREGYDVAVAAHLLRSAMAEQMPDVVLLTKMIDASNAIFPIKAADLMPAFQGPALGQKLSALESQWITSNFTATKEELLNSA